jgi:hypothetical protein
MSSPFPAQAQAFLQSANFPLTTTGESGARDAKFEMLTNKL